MEATSPSKLMLSPLESAEGILVDGRAIRDITTRNRSGSASSAEGGRIKPCSNEELGQFAYVASHDLQEPLRMVASYTQLLSSAVQRKAGLGCADEFLAFAVDGASRMQRLIQDLLAYSRVGTKAQELLDISSEGAFATGTHQSAWRCFEESGAVVTHDPLPTVLA